MDLAGQSHRVLAGSVIAIAHAAAVYGLMASSPQAPTQTARPVELRFIEEAPPARRDWRPHRAIAMTAPIVAAPPVLAEFNVSQPPTDRSITAVQHVTAVVSPAEDRSGPKLVSVVEYLREPAPRYPVQSRRLREQGVVVLRVIIDERGHACDIEIESSSGYARLDRAAQEAVASAAFRPYVEDGAPRRAQVLIPIEFSLNRGSVG